MREDSSGYKSQATDNKTISGDVGKCLRTAVNKLKK